jgi:hypothetical protein
VGQQLATTEHFYDLFIGEPNRKSKIMTVNTSSKLVFRIRIRIRIRKIRNTYINPEIRFYYENFFYTKLLDED